MPASRKARLAAWLQERFFLRFHMALILGLAFAAGLAVTKLFLLSGNTNLALRYGVAVAASYLAFLAGLRLWLWYIAGQRSADDDEVSVGDVIDGLDFAGHAVGDLGADTQVAGFGGGGGEFGGGGASGSFGEAADGVSGLVDGDEGGCAVGVVLVIAAAVLALLLAGLYLVYAAPAILAEAAFHALLAPALVPAVRRADREGWVPGTIRATALPFAAMLITAVGFGLAAAELCPEARRMADVIACARR